MPTANLQRVSARIFPVIGPEVKQMGNWNDPACAYALPCPTVKVIVCRIKCKIVFKRFRLLLKVIIKKMSSDGILLKAPESAQINKIPPHYEATHPKFQQTYNIHSQPNQIFKPVYPSQSGAQHDVAKSSVAISNAILMMQAPANVQNKAEFNKPKVYPGFPERKIPFAPG